MNGTFISFRTLRRWALLTTLLIPAASLPGANPEHVERFLRTGQCPGCDLTEAVFEDKTFANVNLRGAKLNYSRWLNVRLKGGNLGQASMKGAVFSGGSMRSLSLKNADLNFASLENLVLARSDLSNVNLTDADLEGLVLIDLNTREVTLRGRRVRMRGILIRGTRHMSPAFVKMARVRQRPSKEYAAILRTACRAANPEVLREIMKSPLGREAAGNAGWKVVYSVFEAPSAFGRKNRYPRKTLMHVTESLTILKAAGAPLDQRNSAQRTALLALLMGHEHGENFSLKASDYLRRKQYALLLLRNGADPNPPDKGGYTALGAALIRRDYDLVRVLLKHGARADLPLRSLYSARISPLPYLIEKGINDLLQPLLNAGADPDYSDDKGRTALYHAVLNKNIAAMKTLIAAGANLNRRDIRGRTSLDYALRWGRADASELLLRAGAKSTEASLIAAIRGNLDGSAMALLAKGSDLNFRNQAGRTALSYAAEKGKTAIVRALLSRGARADIKDLRGLTPIWYATQPASYELLLKVSGEKFATARSPGGRTFLEHQVFETRPAMVRHLLKQGIRFARSKPGEPTLLLRYVETGVPYDAGARLVAILLDAGQSVRQRDRRGRTPLLIAAEAGVSIPVYRLLLERGADIKAVDKKGRTVLMLEVAAGDSTKHLRYLLSRGADVKARDRLGRTALMYNIHVHPEGPLPSFEIVETLLAGGADANARDKRGYDALMTYLERIGRNQNQENGEAWLIKFTRKFMESGYKPKPATRTSPATYQLARGLRYYKLARLLRAKTR